MRRKPRSLFKARRRGDGLYVGPEFVGPEPNYLPALDRARVEQADKIVPGRVNHVASYHDDDCSIIGGGPCDCEPEVKFTGTTIPTA